MTASVSMQFRPTIAEIDLDAIAANFRTLRKLVEDDAFFCPMVKADAYGHGDGEVANTLRLAGATHLGVATIEEGAALRAVGDQLAILVFGVFYEIQSARALLEGSLTPVLSSWAQVAALESALAERAELDYSLRIHLKFNTGMNRLGFAVNEAPRLRAWLASHPRFRLEGVCTHLLCGEDADDSSGETARQFAEFATALEAFRGLRFHVHALNSAALGAFKHFESARRLYDPTTFGPLGARPGIAIYGAQGSERALLKLPLRPALQLKSRVEVVNHLRSGECVSYGAQWRTQRESWVGVVPIGYADGYLRALSNCGAVLCRGFRVPVIGMVCMDYIMIDMTDIVMPGEQVLHGDEVILIGKQLSVDELAARAGTISYELLTRLGSRVPKRYSRGDVG
jgi:alanine racemase